MENDKIDMSIADDMHFTGNMIKSATTIDNEKEFKVWDFDTFNAVLDASKVGSEKNLKYWEVRKIIMDSVRRLENYLTVLDQQNRMEQCREEADYIKDNVIFECWLDFDASYPEFHSVKSEKRKSFLPF